LKQILNPLLKLGFNRVDGLKLLERPTAEPITVIDPRHPIGLHCGAFLLGILAAVAFDFDHKMKRIIGAMPIVKQHQKIWPILPLVGAVEIGNLKAERVILGISDHLRMRLDYAAKLALPVAVENHPVDMGAARVSPPTERPRRIKVDVDG
jgi:hypothetical protein